MRDRTLWPTLLLPIFYLFLCGTHQRVLLAGLSARTGSRPERHEPPGETGARLPSLRRARPQLRASLPQGRRARSRPRPQRRLHPPAQSGPAGWGHGATGTPTGGDRCPGATATSAAISMANPPASTSSSPHEVRQTRSSKEATRGRKTSCEGHQVAAQSTPRFHTSQLRHLKYCNI